MVPSAKLAARFPRTLANLGAAIHELPCVLILDHNDLATPFRRLAVIAGGSLACFIVFIPGWLSNRLPPS